MASSKSFALLLCALFALVLISSSEALTFDEIVAAREDKRVGCSSPLTCCHYSRSGYCTSCCCCAGSKDPKKLVIASLNEQFGIDCYGLRCCHYSRQGYCTACCAVADSESNPAKAIEEVIAMVAN